MPRTFMQSALMALILSFTLCGCLSTNSRRTATCTDFSYEQTSYQEPARLNSSHHESFEPESRSDPEAVIEVLPTLHESNWTFPNLKANTISAVETAERKIKNLFE